MIKSKKDKNMIQQNRVRSQSEDLYEGFDFEEQMKCHQTLEQLNYYTSNMQFNQQNSSDECTCKCSKCQGFIQTVQTPESEADIKKRLKRREYKKRQKQKAQQKKEQALKDLSSIISDIYVLKTDYETERDKIEQCLKAIQKNVNRFYEFINAVIRQQVETIKKQMRLCLNQIASQPANFSKVPRLYQQFIKVKDASPQVQKIINTFIEIINQKSNQPAKYQKDLDKKTFRFLLISDNQNRNAFLQVIKIIEEGNIKYERQKEMLRMIIEMIKEKNISEQEQDSEQQEQDYEEYDQQDQSNYQYQQHVSKQSATKSSQREDYNNDFDQDPNQFDQNQKQNRQNQRKNSKRRRKNKNLKHYQTTYEKTLESLILLQRTLLNNHQEKMPCNLDEEWMARFKERHLTERKPNQKKT